MTWPNALAVLSVGLEALQLSALCVAANWPGRGSDSSDASDASGSSGSGNDGDEDDAAGAAAALPEWVTSGAAALSFSSEALPAAVQLTYAAWACAAVWLVVVTLPLAQQASPPPKLPAPQTALSDASRWGGPVAAPADPTWSTSSSSSSSSSSGGSSASGWARRQRADAAEARRRADSGLVTASPLFRHATAFLGSFAFVSLVLVLQPGGACWQRLGPGARRATSSCAFLFFLVTSQVDLFLLALVFGVFFAHAVSRPERVASRKLTTAPQVLSADSALRSMPSDAGVDVRYPQVKRRAR